MGRRKSYSLPEDAEKALVGVLTNNDRRRDKFRELFNQNTAQFGEPGSKLRKRAENRRTYLKSLQQEKPDQFNEILEYLNSTTGPTTTAAAAAAAAAAEAINEDEALRRQLQNLAPPSAPPSYSSPPPSAPPSFTSPPRATPPQPQPTFTPPRPSQPSYTPSRTMSDSPKVIDFDFLNPEDNPFPLYAQLVNEVQVQNHGVTENIKRVDVVLMNQNPKDLCDDNDKLRMWMNNPNAAELVFFRKPKLDVGMKSYIADAAEKEKLHPKTVEALRINMNAIDEDNRWETVELKFGGRIVSNKHFTNKDAWPDDCVEWNTFHVSVKNGKLITSKVLCVCFSLAVVEDRRAIIASDAKRRGKSVRMQKVTEVMKSMLEEECN